MNLRTWWTHRSGMAKTVTTLAVVLCLGIGLCGLDFFLTDHGIGKRADEFGVGPLDGISLAVMLVSALGLAIALIAWLIIAVYKALDPGFGKR